MKRLLRKLARKISGPAGTEMEPEASPPPAASGPAEPLSDDERMRQQARECKDAHTHSNYFELAEPFIEQQWNEFIWPNIKDGHDFRRILDLAPGHGRNANRLKEFAEDLHLVDINQTCIDACRQRFANDPSPCRFHFYVTDGTSLAGIRDASITFVYSWDSMVHFDPTVIRSYVKEFARIMEPGARGFIHHANYGNINPDATTWTENPHWRSNMTKELFEEYVTEAGLVLRRQQVMPWSGVQGLDCLSLFEKPA